MLLTHHPLIFRGLKQINDQDFIGRRVLRLIQQDMSYYAMHTNFDVAGMANPAAELLQLSETEVLQRTGATETGAVGIGKVGILPCKMSISECAEWTKKAFNLETVKVFGWPAQIEAAESRQRTEQGQHQSLRRVAVCPGSGKSVISDAQKAGAQVLITGDIGHHEGIDAAAQGLVVIDAGHYGVEKIFIPYMEQYLQSRLPEVTVIAQVPKQPFIYV